MVSPHEKSAWILAAFALAVLAASPAGFALAARSQEPSSSSDADAKKDLENVRSILVRHCYECHGVEKPTGDFRLDRLSPDFGDDDTREKWLAVVERVQKGEMPPKGKPRPTAHERATLVEWIGGRLKAAAADQQAVEGRAVLRRLNRAEYENTVRNLLGIEIDLKELLPQDTSASGFDNVGEALHTSSFLMEKYLEAADKALDLAIANLPQPPLVQKRISLKDTHQVKSTTERVYRRFGDDGVVMFSSSAWNSVVLSPFYPPDRGKYRLRISAYGVQSDGKPVTYRVDAGPMLMGTKSHLIGYFDAPPDSPAVVEFVDHFEARSTIRIAPYGLASAQVVNKIGADEYDGPGLAVEWVEVEGPLHDTWPPESHRRIFGELPQESAPIYNYRNRVEVVAKDPVTDAQRVLRTFARRAFRRSVTDDDVAPFVTLVEKKLADGYSFEQAMRVGLKGVMVSPEFLFLHEKPGNLDDFALASRLSYFLWSTMPDEELLALASDTDPKRERGSLPADASLTLRVSVSDPDALRQQVERMLNDPKAAAFTENFVGQWLGLRDIDFTEPDHLLYPEFDDMLKAAMVQETHLFFNELLKNDLSLTNFVASNFTFLNERLAKHYGIPGVEGHAFRKVALPPDSHRGGVMTMASVLKVTANGTVTSPIVRGAWVLDRILGTPPKPPPGGVPAIEPDIRGATTIREQLAKHRQIESCATCHTHIDPPGFALESFDVIGGWRDNYRITGWRRDAQEVVVDGRKMRYYHAQKVDPADQLPDGRHFQNIDELKQLLLDDKDQLARGLTTKLLTYATGRAPQPDDRPEIDAIVTRVRDKNYGLRSLVHEIAQSTLFQNK
jgi:mono/diheme cytochrome c family protein